MRPPGSRTTANGGHHAGGHALDDPPRQRLDDGCAGSGPRGRQSMTRPPIPGVHGRRTPHHPAVHHARCRPALAQRDALQRRTRWSDAAQLSRRRPDRQGALPRGGALGGDDPRAARSPPALSFESIDQLDHAIFVDRHEGKWGLVARSRDPGLHGRLPCSGGRATWRRVTSTGTLTSPGGLRCTRSCTSARRWGGTTGGSRPATSGSSSRC